MKKAVFTLDIDNYAPSVTALTRPYLEQYAQKIGADFAVINSRKFPGWPPTYEKLQIYEHAQHYDWSIYFDADVLVHPDLFDITEHLTKDTVLHWNSDMAGNRWTYDRYFRRDGRHLGSGNWLAIASDWCRDLWRPLDDLTLADAVANIHPTIAERNFGVTPEHLIDDYTLSRNIAKYGLKFRSFVDVQKQLGREGETYFFHNYLLTEEEKAQLIRDHLKAWGLVPPLSDAAQEMLAEAELAHAALVEGRNGQAALV